MVTRVAAWMVATGVVLSVGLGFLQYQWVHQTSASGATIDTGLGIVPEHMAGQWVLIAAVMLAGLALLRRWLINPLSRLMAMIGANAGAEPFYREARLQPGEFGQLAAAIGGMLCRLENTTDQLRHQDKALEDLHQLAPAAMIGIDPRGKITEANQRAAQLFRCPTDGDLIGHDLFEHIHSQDVALLRRAIDRLDLENRASCDLRTGGDEATREVHVDCIAVRDHDGRLASVRLAMLDVSPIRQLQRQLSDDSRLLNLIIDHMSDAIVWVDDQGRIAAHNQQLRVLMRRDDQLLTGTHYDPQTFWDELGLIDHDKVVGQLRQIDADRRCPAQQRVETRVGTFLFQGVPVDDESGRPVGRLWVVQEITAQEQSKRLIDQQTHQLQAVKQLAFALAGVTSIEELLTRAGQILYDLLGADALGLALRDGRERTRGVQVLHRGEGGYLLEANQALVQAVQCELMPQVLRSGQLTFWPDLPPSSLWSPAFERAGLTCLASAPLAASADAQGILWIARRGGKRLERHQIYLLDALAPMLAARIEFARLRQRLHDLDQTDQVTDLPNEQLFINEVRRQDQSPGSQWGMVIVRLDHFDRLRRQRGYPATDRLLRDIGAVIQRRCRKSNVVGRLDGPCFAVLCRNTERQHVLGLAQRLHEAVRTYHHDASDEACQVTASVGAASAPQDGSSAVRVLAQAASRADIARSEGGDRAVWDDKERQRRAG